uniref:Uncharacterized protein n=1 Tax=Anguilla anguilla TaxID=7936 RepID=A0A0E9WFG9_ANGAN
MYRRIENLRVKNCTIFTQKTFCRK